MSKWSVHLSTPMFVGPEVPIGAKYHVTDEAGNLITGGLSAADAQRLCEAWDLVRPYIEAQVDEVIDKFHGDVLALAEMFGS